MPELPAHVVYTKELIHKHRGYPFWYPEPDSSAPDEVKKRGILPGDVGIINKYGGFDFLFSIFRNDDGLVVGNAPEGFQPASVSDQQVAVPYVVHGNALKSEHASYTEVSVDASAQVLSSTVDAGMSLDVNTSDVSAAILCLPNYSVRYEAPNDRFFEKFARQHGVSWYKHVIGTLDRNVQNGFLYLITGSDKTDTWGNAVARRTDRHFAFSLKCTLANVSGATVKVANSWINDAGVENGLFPIPSYPYTYPTDLRNQCIFARGFTISVSEKLLGKTWLAVPNPIKGSYKDRLPSFDSKEAPLPPSDGKTGFSTYLSSFIGSKTVPNNSDSDQRRMMAESADSQGSFVAEVSEFPPLGNQILNPSMVMNEYLLSKDPSLEIVVTHDKEWMDVMKEYEKDTYLTEEELWYKLKDLLDAKLSSNVYQTPLRLYDGSRFWAVLIGINAYPTTPLHGCVSDAMEMAKYLIEDLRVPEDHIQYLLGSSSWPHSQSDDGYIHSPEQFIQSYPSVNSKGNNPSIPTRENIVNTLLNLSIDPRIQRGDNIIIYFAGMGSVYFHRDYYPKGSIKSYGSNTALCPMDRTAPHNNGVGIPDISDREINIILSEIAGTKGRHITVILDCCHSSGVTRGIPGSLPQYRADPPPPTSEGKSVPDVGRHPSGTTRDLSTERHASPLPSTSVNDMFDAADTRLRGLSKNQPVDEDFWVPDVKSHVLLAACQEYQPAKEEKGPNGYNGVFTRALIDALKSNVLTKELTYDALIRRINELYRLSNVEQTPIAIGEHKNTRLWYQDSSNI